MVIRKLTGENELKTLVPLALSVLDPLPSVEGMNVEDACLDLVVRTP